VYIDGTDVYSNNSTINPETIRTHRLVSISGCILPVNTVAVERPVFVPRYSFTTTTIPEVPEFTYTIDGGFSQIANDSNQYCPCDFQNSPLIEDGPVVVAQEIYHQGGFDNGTSKSRITVIADASMIQGKLAFYDAASSTRTRNFLNSLYPQINFPSTNQGRQYENTYKIVSPERASPLKLVNYTNNSGLLVKFRGDLSSYTNKVLNTFSDNDHSVDPNFYSPMLYPPDGKPDEFLERREEFDETGYQEALDAEILTFKGNQSANNAYCKFSGVINGKMYQDSSIYGEVPELMKDTGYDYIDLQMLTQYSGYPGDLFGYSVRVKNGNIYVGCPFAPFESENITDWDKVIENTPSGQTASGISIDYNGGAGAVFIFDKFATANQDYYVANPWGCVRKLRPSSINSSDMFGLDFDIDGDVLAVAAPGHDFDTIFNKNINSGEFVTKEFNEQFNIAKTNSVDLGSSGNRQLYGSGIITNNNGAVYAYENKITDWSSKSLDWSITQKLLPQGFNAKEDDNFFGYSVSIDRARRKDGDYTLIIGTPFNTSGINNTYSTLSDAGIIYTYDAMLRRPRPSIAHPDTYIAGSVIGKSGENYPPKVQFYFANNEEFNKRYINYGRLFSNENGEIFVEVSGKDMIDKGFITHRPYIEYIRGSYDFGKRITDSTSLFVEGKRLETNGSMNLYTKYYDSLNVYNNMTLYVDSVSGVSSGNILLYSSGIMPDNIKFDTLVLTVEAANPLSTDSMNLNTRGMF
jgi:hypothetical protein